MSGSKSPTASGASELQSRASESATERDAAADDHLPQAEGGGKGTVGLGEAQDNGVAGGGRDRLQASPDEWSETDTLDCPSGGSDEADLNRLFGENERRNGLPEARQLFFWLKPRARCPQA